MHLADVVLQVEGGGEVGLAVAAGAHQHRFVRGVSVLVPAQGVGLLELLLACLACKCGCWKMWGGVSIPRVPTDSRKKQTSHLFAAVDLLVNR